MSAVPSSVCSSLQQLLKNVIGHKIGVCAREIELVQVASGKSALEKKANIAIDDRFKLKIPISDLLMSWDIIFNCSLPNCPPDFDLNDLDFFCNITLDTIEPLLPSLNSWDHREDKSLINLISELRSAYLKYQVESVIRLQSIDNRCFYEYTALLESLQERGLDADAVEVLIENSTVHFTIKIDTEVPHCLLEPGTYVIALAVKWGMHSRSGNLITSPNLVRLIGTSLELHRNINYGESLSEYTEEVRKSIEKQIFSVIEKRQRKRKEYIFQLLKIKGRSILNYDVLDYKFCNFLDEKNGFLCIVNINLDETFPNSPPVYRLISVYSSANNIKPLSQVVSNVPFSEVWDTPNMVEQAVIFIEKLFQIFKDATVPCFKLPK